MKHFKNMEDVLEYRDIKLTSKRQITIPKSFFDNLDLEDSVQAYLFKDGIFLKPKREVKSTYEEDLQRIIKKVIEDGYKGDELVREISERIAHYNKFLDKRIQEFIEDMSSDSVSTEGEEDFYGLEVFFDKKNGKINERS